MIAVAQRRLRRAYHMGLGLTLGLPLLANPAYASGSSMPWESPLNSILESIEGPVAKIIAVMVIIMTGLSLAFGETSGGFRRLIQIVRSEEHTSELQSLMRISYAVFCFKKKKHQLHIHNNK